MNFKNRKLLRNFYKLFKKTNFSFSPQDIDLILKKRRFFFNKNDKKAMNFFKSVYTNIE